MRDVHILPDIDALSRTAAEETITVINSAIELRGSCALALSGGNTPRSLYRMLGTTYQDQISWGHVHLYWGDERYVPADNPASNYRMARETLLGAIPIPPEHVHPMPTHHAAPDAAAREYEMLLRAQFDQEWPRFDMIFLGLAPDGHIASLFPGSKAIMEDKRSVVAVRVPKEPPQRLTLTLPAINHSANVVFLVAGRAKAGALHRALVGPCDVQTCPAAGVKPVDGTVTWWIDEAAATFLGAAGRTRSN